MWLHVDAAYGAGARLSVRAAGLVPGLERADSVTVDPHKWFFQAYDIGGLVVRNREDLVRTFHKAPEYYRSTRPEDEPLNWYQYSLEGTRRFRALKLWFSWKHLGTEGFGRLIDHNLDLAAYLISRFAAGDDFEALPETPDLSIVCFRHVPGGRERAKGLEPDALDAYQDLLQRALEVSGRGWVSTTTLRGRTYLRAGVVELTGPLAPTPTASSRPSHATPRRSHDGTRTLSDLADQLRASAAASAFGPVDGELTVPGLHSRVEVLRDEWGVAYISAASLDDLWFAQGWVTASERCFQLELALRAGDRPALELFADATLADGPLHPDDRLQPRRRRDRGGLRRYVSVDDASFRAGATRGSTGCRRRPRIRPARLAPELPDDDVSWAACGRPRPRLGTLRKLGGRAAAAR